MRPVIVVWTYLALGVLLLEDFQSVISILNDYRMSLNDKPVSFETPVYLLIMGGLFKINAVLSPVFIVAILFSIIGLTRKSQWARIISFVTVGSDALLIFVIGSYILFVEFVFPVVEPLPDEIADVAISSLFVGVLFMAFSTPFLFLAYKIYSSKRLKTYLENQDK